LVLSLIAVVVAVERPFGPFITRVVSEPASTGMIKGRLPAS